MSRSIFKTATVLVLFLSLSACQSKAYKVAETQNEANYKIHEANQKALEETTEAQVKHGEVVREAVVPLDKAKLEYNEEQRIASEKVYNANQTLINKQNVAIADAKKVEAEATQEVIDAAD